MLVKMELNDQETQAFGQLLDVAVKSAGMAAVPAAFVLGAKLDAAVKQAKEADAAAKQAKEADAAAKQAQAKATEGG